MATLSVKLVKPHTHAGQHYPAGAELTIHETDATFLLRAGVIEKKPAAKSTQQSAVQETKNV